MGPTVPLPGSTLERIDETIEESGATHAEIAGSPPIPDPQRKHFSRSVILTFASGMERAQTVR